MTTEAKVAGWKCQQVAKYTASPQSRNQSELLYSPSVGRKGLWGLEGSWPSTASQLLSVRHLRTIDMVRGAVIAVRRSRGGIGTGRWQAVGRWVYGIPTVSTWFEVSSLKSGGREGV